MDNTLASFTDVLDDEICDSQPISLSNESNTAAQYNMNVMGACANARPNKGTGQQGQFRSIEEIDPKYRDVFTYPYFNLVQSNVIDDALYSDKSIVVCAPTGSGKTVIFEMAIVQLLMELEDKQYSEDFKIIYMAPVKALCTERLTEWYPKFTKLGLMCIEATGDTDVDFTQLKPYKIIITTPEKWDMLTRRWRDHSNLVEVIKLFLIDEVHILNDETRGPVLEAVVSRMKTIESSAQSVHRIEKLQNQLHGSEMTHKTAPSIRFVAVSATVSNPEDVANWLGTTNKPAVFHKFGDECRPVKLKRVIEGYPCAEGSSIFKFDIILNYKLWPIIQKYHSGKPTLIFCNTRKSVILTAETLSRELTINFSAEQKAKLTALASTIKNKKLQSLVMCGVGCHHAGLLYEERQTIEHAFRNRDLPILITTTTLAMGVNLPAHLVIIKNTQQYVNGTYQEYSISTVLQMVGRAGRPQFDTDATAVIMTRLADKGRYQALVGGCEPLQSFLHKRLPENLNSEAALGTVGDVAQCVQWLRSTFLYVRAARDPKRYLNLSQNSPQHLIAKKIEELCVKAMNSLASAGLITMDEASCIESTEAGRLMSIFYLDLETMKQLMKIGGTESLDQLLTLICESHELADMHLRVDERRCLNALNRNNAAATIRFPMKGKITTRQMKLNCIIQAVLGCLAIPDPSLNQEAMKIIRIVDRVCKCLVAYVTRPDLVSHQPKFYSAVLNSIILAKCIAAHLWENSPFVSKQLKGIGPTFSTLLATAGKVNFMLLEESHPRDLERIMNKGPPAGNVLRKQVSLLPKYQLSMVPIDESTVMLQLVLLNQNYLSDNIEELTAGPNHKSYIIVGDSNNHLLLLTSFKDKDLLSVFDGSISHEIRRICNDKHKILAHCISTSFVGIDVDAEYGFNDLNKLFGSSCANYCENETPVKETVKRQTCITDTFKERKRKAASPLENIQSKEKKKRDKTLIENFKYLKKTFETATKNIQANSNICQKLCNLPNYTNNTRPDKVTRQIEKVSDHSNKITSDIYSVEGIDSDDDIDDDKVDNILTEIENEMHKNNKMSTNSKTNITSPINVAKPLTVSTIQKESTNKAATDLLMNPYKTMTFRKKRKPLISKSNYNFIELLERNLDLSDNDEKTVTNSESNGFSETIKTQINNYIQRTETKSKTPDTNIHQLLSNENKQKSNTTTVSDKEDVTVLDTEEKLPPTQQVCHYEIKDILGGNDIPKTCKNTKQKEEIANTTFTTPKEVDDSQSSCYNFKSNKNTVTHLDTENTLVPTQQLYTCNQMKEILGSCNTTTVYGKTKQTDPLKNVTDMIMIPENDAQQSILRVDSKCYTQDINNQTVFDIEQITPSEVNNCRIQCEVYETNLTEASIGNTTNSPNKSSQSTHSLTKIRDTTVTDENITEENYQKVTNQNDHTNKVASQLFCVNESDSKIIVNDEGNQFKLDVRVPLSIYETKRVCGRTHSESQPIPRYEYDDLTDYRQKETAFTTSIGSYCNESYNNPSQLINCGLETVSVNSNNTNDGKSGYTESYKYTSTKIDFSSKQLPEYYIQLVKKVQVDLNITKVVSTDQCRQSDNLIFDSEISLENNNAFASYMRNPKFQNIHSSLASVNKYNTMTHEQQTIDNSMLMEENIKAPRSHQQNRVPGFDSEISTKEIVSRTPCIQAKNTSSLNIKDSSLTDSKENTNEMNIKIITESDNKEIKNEEVYDQNNLKNTNIDTKPPQETDNVVQAGSNKVQNILKKYSKMLANDIYKQTPNFSIINKTPRTTLPNTKLSKPFKISDIQKLHTPLPSIIITTEKDDGQNVSLTNLPDFAPVPYNIESIFEDIPPNDTSTLEPIDLPLDLNLEPIENMKIDHSMFDPKTLLQCTVEFDDIIPPPPQFSDYTPMTTSYSPHSESQICTDNTYYRNNIFKDQTITHLTPSREIETWTLAEDDCWEDNYTSPLKSYTVMHKNTPSCSLSRDNITSRQTKLGQFKFSERNKIKKWK